MYSSLVVSMSMLLDRHGQNLKWSSAALSQLNSIAKDETMHWPPVIYKGLGDIFWTYESFNEGAKLMNSF
jgi:hypothetical protein